MVPWREFSLAIALIASAAAPAFLIATAGIWEAAAGDEIAVRLADAGPATDRSIVVDSPAYFTRDTTTTADRAVRASLDELDGYGDVRRTLASLPADRGSAATETGDTIDVALRLVNHTGAIEAITPVVALEGRPQGVWISAWLADEAELSLGDQIVSQECPADESDPSCLRTLPEAPLTVIGIYETLWDEEGSPAGLRVIPGIEPALIPRFIRPFGDPNYALLLATDELMEDLQAPGTARWSATLDRPIEGVAELRERVRSFRALENTIATGRSLTDPLGSLAAGQGATDISTTLPTTLAATLDALATLDQPFQSVLAGGIALGLAAMAAGAAFTVMRRSKEFRLLAGEGDRWPDFARRAAAQLVAPTLVGTIIGISAAVAVGQSGTWQGSSASAASGGSATEDRVIDAVSLGSIDMPSIVLVAIVGIGLGALVTGFMGQRALGDRPPLATTEMAGALLVTLAAVAGLLWVQVGAGTGASGSRAGGGSTSEVDIAVVALPLTVLIAAVAVAMLSFRWLIGRLDPLSDRLSPVLLLAWRRVGSRDPGSQIVIGVLAVALGLVLFTTALVATLEDTVDLKLATEIGSETIVELVGPIDDRTELPERTTVIGLHPGRVSPGDRRVQVVAVDPATVADAVTWPDEYGVSIEQALDLLASDVGDAIPAIAIEGETLPRRGSFVLRVPVRYEIVATVPSTPLATSFGSTLLVGADRVDAYVTEEYERTGGFGLLPSERARQRLVSALPGTDVQQFLDENEVRERGVITATQRRADASFVAPRYAFGYLRWFGAVAALGSLIALLFYLAARRNRRALSAIMLRRMGLSPTLSALVTAIEVLVLTTIGAATALAVSPAVTQRLLPRFDPAPGLPPNVDTSFPVAQTLLLLVVGLTTLTIAVWVVERRAMMRPEGPVLRATE
jgi:hypothetical protein